MYFFFRLKNSFFRLKTCISCVPTENVWTENEDLILRLKTCFLTKNIYFIFRLKMFLTGNESHFWTENLFCLDWKYLFHMLKTWRNKILFFELKLKWYFGLKTCWTEDMYPTSAVNAKFPLMLVCFCSNALTNKSYSTNCLC